MDFRISIDIGAPPSVVWSVLIDGERWSEWTSTVKSVQLLDPGPLAVGSRARIRQPRLPPAIWSVTEVQNGQSLTLVTKSPGVSVTAQHGVESTPHGARATLSLRFTGLLGSVVGRLTRRLNDRYLAVEAAGLKRRSEELARESSGAA